MRTTALSRAGVTSTGCSSALLGAVKTLPTLLSSSGLTDEAVTFYLARGLTKSGPGGGDGSESIVAHEVPLAGLPAWLKALPATTMIDAKLLAGIYAASALLEEDAP